MTTAITTIPWCVAVTYPAPSSSLGGTTDFMDLLSLALDISKPNNLKPSKKVPANLYKVENIKDEKTDEAKELLENARTFWQEIAEDGFVR